MKISAKYQKLHSYCFGNRELLKKNKECVCIDCGAVFDPAYLDEVDFWAWHYDINDTAICPFCSVDSIIPRVLDDGYIVTDEDIIKLEKYYFN